MKHLNDELSRDFPGANLKHQDMRTMTEIEKAIDSIVARGEQVKFARPQPANETLGDQFAKVEAINRALRDRIGRERMRLLHDHDRRWTETQHDFAVRIHEAVNQLEREREAELRRLADEYHEAAREIDKIASRFE